jgi:hypothetical protein
VTRHISWNADIDEVADVDADASPEIIDADADDAVVTPCQQNRRRRESADRDRRMDV